MVDLPPSWTSPLVRSETAFNSSSAFLSERPLTAFTSADHQSRENGFARQGFLVPQGAFFDGFGVLVEADAGAHLGCVVEEEGHDVVVDHADAGEESRPPLLEVAGALRK